MSGFSHAACNCSRIHSPGGSEMSARSRALRLSAWILFATLAVAPWSTPFAQAPAVQKYDVEYTNAIKQYLTDPRISTELVDHLPASDKVPTPLKFLGHIVGQPGYLDYAKDIHACMKA